MEELELSFFEREIVKKYYNNPGFDGTIHEFPKENVKETIYKDCKNVCFELFYIFHKHEDDTEKIIMDDKKTLEQIYDELVKKFVSTNELEVARDLIQNRKKRINKLDKELRYNIDLCHHRIQWRIEEMRENVFLEFLVMNRVIREIAINIQPFKEGFFGEFKYPEELIELKEDFIKALSNCYESYSDFDSLYDDAIMALKERRKMFKYPLPESDKGKWVYVGSNTYSFKDYLENYLRISIMFRYIWRTDHALFELMRGNYYVFVDEAGVPRISVVVGDGEVLEIEKGFSYSKKLTPEYQEEVDKLLNCLNATNITKEYIEGKELLRHLNGNIKGSI